MTSSAVATFAGMGSGLPVQQLIDATINANSTRLNNYKTSVSDSNKQQSAYKTVQAKYSSLDSTLQKVIDSKMIYAFDLFDRKSVTVSDNSVASVSVGQGAISGSAEIKVNSLAKPPLAAVSDFAGPVTNSIDLTQLGVISGAFAFNFNTVNGGVSIEQDILSGDTLNSYMAKVNQAITTSNDGLVDTVTGKVHASGLSGSISYNVDATGTLSLDFSGVTGGTINAASPFSQSKSNFADVFGLTDTADPNILTGVPKSSLNLDGKLSDNSAGIKALGTLTFPETINIGGLDIEITADTTLRNIMNTVNESTACQVNMKYDQTSNTMNFKAKDDFYSDYIYFSGKALLSDIGVTKADGVVDTSKQTKRQKGEIVLDGKTISIKSNKVTAAETGLTGVNINLTSVTKVDEPLKISISDNTTDLVSAMKNVVGAFNALSKTITDYTFVNIDTGESGALKSDYSINSMKTTLQMIMMSPVSDNASYKALSLIGISSDGGTFTLDESKFLNALNDNSSDVKKLLIGNKEKTVKGVFEKVQDQVKVYTDSQIGFFATKATSIARSIKDLNKSITDEQSRLDQERARLVQQYSNLDSMMSKYQSQASSFTSSG